MKTVEEAVKALPGGLERLADAMAANNVEQRLQRQRLSRIAVALETIALEFTKNNDDPATIEALRAELDAAREQLMIATKNQKEESNT